MEVILDSGAISTTILEKWKHDFSSLFVSKTNCSSFVPGVGDNSIPFNEHMYVLEIKRAVDSAKRGKPLGADSIYIEVLKNDVAILFMHTIPCLIYVLIRVLVPQFGVNVL